MVCFNCLQIAFLISAMMLQEVAVFGASRKKFHLRSNSRKAIVPFPNPSKYDALVKASLITWKNHKVKTLAASTSLLVAAGYFGSKTIYNYFQNRGKNKSRGSNELPPNGSAFWATTVSDREWIINWAMYLVVGVLAICALAIVYFYYCHPMNEEEEGTLPSAAAATATATAPASPASIASFASPPGGGKVVVVVGSAEGKSVRVAAAGGQTAEMKAKSKSTGRPVGAPAQQPAPPPPTPSSYQGSAIPKVKI